MILEFTLEEERQSNQFIEAQKRASLCLPLSVQSRWVYEVRELDNGCELSITDLLTAESLRVCSN